MNDGALGARAGALVVAASLLLLGVGLGWTDVSAPDEPRYIQVAEEMRAFEHGAAGIVLLHLNGDPYTQKPPLYYAVAAALGGPGGRVTEALARAPSALAGIACVWITLLLGTQLLGRTAGVLGAAMLLTVFEFANLARRVQLDVLLALFELIALYAFWQLDRGRWSARRSAALFHAALALAVLTKGPVGFLVPVLAAVSYLAWEGRLRDLRRLFPAWGPLISLGPPLLWVAGAVALAPAGFADEALGTNLIGRFFSGTSHERPFYYFLYQFPIDFLPWTLLWPWVAWAARKRVFVASNVAGATVDQSARRSWRLLLSCVGASLVFFSISSGKRGLYMVPAFPAAALLCADALIRLLEERRGTTRALDWTAGGFALLLAAVGAAALCVSLGLLPAGPAGDDLRAWLAAVNGARLRDFGIVVVGVVLFGGVGWRWARSRSQLAPAGIALAVAFAVEAAVFGLLYTALDPIRSPRPIAEAAAALTPEGASVGLFRDRALIGGLVYYGGRHVAALETPEAVRAFAEEGGHALVVKARKLDRVASVTPLEVTARVRPGRRAVVIARPSFPGSVGSEAH